MKLMKGLKKFVASISLFAMVMAMLPNVALASKPTSPVLLKPSASELLTTVEKDLVFEWAPAIDNDGHNPVYYKFQISTSPETDPAPGSKFSGPIAYERKWRSEGEVNPLTATQLSATAEGITFVSGTTYYWHVRAEDVSGGALANRSDWSEVRSFTVDNVAPEITGVQDGGMYFSQAAVNFDHGSGSYVLNGAGAVPFESGTLFTEIGTYSIVVSDGANDSFVTFTILDPSAPVLKSPIDQAQVNSLDPALFEKLTWYELGSAGDAEAAMRAMSISSGIEYKVQVSEVVDFSTLTIDGDWQEDVNYFFASPLAEGQYFWRVQARDAAKAEGPWSEQWSFVVDNTAPKIAELADKRANAELTVTSLATDTNGVAKYSWSAEKITGEGEVFFGTPGSHETSISANKDGDYKITLTATDPAGNSSSESFVLSWDTTVNPVTGLYVATGTNFADLHWTNPTDEDFNSVKIYRSAEADKLGTELAVLTDGEEIYKDDTVLGGVTYYYTVVATDNLGNTAASNIEVTPELLATETLSVVTEDADDYVPPVTKNDEPKEVKSSTKEEEKNEDKEENKNLPAVGIGILVLIALLGAYLLYLQYPEMFGKFLFWKKKKNINSTLKPKK